MRGIEAFVELDSSQPLDYFRGWRMLSAEPHERRSTPAFRSLRHFEFASGLRLSDEHALDERCLSALQHLVGRLGVRIMPPPRVYLLWQNSD